MIKQLVLDMASEIAVDNFAGGGGASTGIERALGRFVDLAINHDPEALAMHEQNHPQTRHLCEDVFAVDPVKACAGRRVGVAWFSPDCKDFSKAKGGKPVSKKIRGLAWVMVKWAASFKKAGLPMPRVMFLENVEEFTGWGPLLADGSRCPKRKGKTYRNFVARLRNLGYKVEARELRCCDYGAPTIRKRLFLIARCDGQPIVWPEPTHGKPGSPGVESGKLKPWRTAAECIDFTLPCPSIFLTKKEAKQFGVKRPLVDATMRRIARGVFKFVINNPKPFIVKVNHTGYDQFRGQETDQPLQTITSKHPYALVSPSITKFRTGATGSPCDEPLHTVTAGPKKNPAGAAHAMGLVSATLIQTGQGERKGQKPRVPGLDKPLGTVVAGGGRHAVVQAELSRMWEHGRFRCHKCGMNFGVNDYESNSVTCPKCGNTGIDTISDFLQDGGAIDVAPFIQQAGHYQSHSDMVKRADEPLRTQATKQEHMLVAARTEKVASFLAKHYGGHETPGQAVDKPADTVTAKDHNALVAVNVVRHFGQSVGSPADAPVGSTTADGGGKTGIVTSHLAKLYGTTTGQPTDTPIHTVTGGGNHIAEVRAFLVKYYSCGREAGQSLDEPAHTIRSKACLGLVTVHGEEYIITDIGMRMLEPRELFLAQDFPPGYIIEFPVPARDKRGKVKRDKQGNVKMKMLPKHAQVRMCGNSVPPVMPEVLIKANAPDMCLRRRRRAA